MNDRYDNQTYYELLEINPTAGPSEIYNAYQRARSTYSPSSPAIYSMFTAEEAQALMSLIEEAYQTLSHQARRKEYDVKIGIAKPVAKPLPPVGPLSPNRNPSSGKSSEKSEDSWIGPVRVERKREELPAGFSRTRFSVYEVNPELEKELEAVETCDGLFLQKVRLYKGVTLDQLSDEMRVSKSTLVALETNDLDALPVAVFTRGFVVQISRALGLNERKITDAYMKYYRATKG